MNVLYILSLNIADKMTVTAGKGVKNKILGIIFESKLLDL